MNQFVKKGFGKIYVKCQEDVARVNEILKQVNFFEWDGYAPDNLIAVFPEDGNVVLDYTGKYEACIDAITLECWKQNIPVWCISQHFDRFEPETQEPRVEIKVTLNDTGDDASRDG